ncbi:MAG TPA: hypothetical protein VF779_12830 [Pyrinomonadaceae bacterium]
MKKWFVLSLTAVLFLATHSLINAQEINTQKDPRPFNTVEDMIAKAITAELPGWKRTSVPPMNRDGLDNFRYDVIIDQWSSEEGNVKVALLLYQSEDDAKSKFEEFKAGVKANEQLQDVDNEAFAWGISESIALRRGSYSVYISSIAKHVQNDDVFSDKRPGEEAKLNKLFAKIIAKALKDIR